MHLAERYLVLKTCVLQSARYFSEKSHLSMPLSAKSIVDRFSSNTNSFIAPNNNY